MTARRVCPPLRLVALPVWAGLAWAGTVAADFELALWPGEGRPVLQTAGTELALRDEPEWSACPERMAIEPGVAIEFDETRYRTVRAGEAVAARRMVIHGRSFGPVEALSRRAYYRAGVPTARVAVEPGQAVEYLQPRAEGGCLLRVAGGVLETAPCVIYDAARFDIVDEPVIEWWVRAETGGRHGWTLVDGRNLVLTGRTFVTPR
jgi:hypothetical protein